MNRNSNLCLIALLVATAILPRSAAGVLVFLKGRDEPLRAQVVSESEDRIVFQVVNAFGRKQQQTLLRSEIEDILESVSEDRLAALRPTEPRAYYDYAEELAEKRKDPDAQETAIRLLLIAAGLDAADLGHRSLLLMASLARTPQEEMRMRALAYLLDAQHDRRVLRPPSVDSGPRSAEGDPQRALLKALRQLRRNDRREALHLAQRPGFGDLLESMSDHLTYEQFLQACQPICQDCVRGLESCTQCLGSGVFRRDGRSVVCDRCRGARKVTCAHCLGNYRDPPLSQVLLWKVLQLEAKLDSTGPPLAARRVTSQTWSQSLAQPTAPLRPLTLETLTEFNPRHSLFQTNRWVQPE